MFEDQTPTQFFTPSGRLSLFLILLLVTIFITLCILFCCRDFLKRMRNLKRNFSRPPRTSDVESKVSFDGKEKLFHASQRGRKVFPGCFRQESIEHRDFADDPCPQKASKGRKPQSAQSTVQFKITNSFDNLFSPPLQENRHTQHQKPLQQQHQPQQHQQHSIPSPKILDIHPTKEVQNEEKTSSQTQNDVDEAFAAYRQDTPSSPYKNVVQDQRLDHSPAAQKQPFDDSVHLVKVMKSSTSLPHEPVEMRVHQPRRVQRSQFPCSDPSTISKHLQDEIRERTHFSQKSPQHTAASARVLHTSHSIAENRHFISAENHSTCHVGDPVRSNSVSRQLVDNDRRKSRNLKTRSSNSFYMEEWWKCPKYRARSKLSGGSCADLDDFQRTRENLPVNNLDTGDSSKEHMKKLSKKIQFNEKHLHKAKVVSNSDLRSDQPSKKILISSAKINSFEVQGDKKWNSMELTESVFYERKFPIREHNRRVKSYDYFCSYEDPFKITEFLNGPYHDEDHGIVESDSLRLSNAKICSAIHSKPVLGVSFEDDSSVESHRSKKTSLNDRVEPNRSGDMPLKQKIRFQGKPEENTSSLKTSQKNSIQLEVARWSQDSKIRRQTFSMAVIPPTRESTSSTTAHTTTGNGTNSFDSVATEHDASGSSSRCGVTTTSIESSATNASTDSTSDSKSHKLHQMRDDSGYKSLEAQQSLRKMESDPPWSAGPLTKTSQMFKFVAQKLKVSSSTTKSLEFFRSATGISTSMEDSLGQESNQTIREIAKQPTIHHKPSFIARRATLLFGFGGSENPISSIFDRRKVCGSEIDAEKFNITKEDTKGGFVQKISPDQVEKVTREKPKLKIFEKIDSEPTSIRETFSNNEKVSSSLDGSSKTNISTVTSIEIAKIERKPKDEKQESEEADITKSQSVPSSRTNSFAVCFNRMLSKAELYISATKSQAESIFLGLSGSVEQPGSPNKDDLQGPTTVAFNSEQTPPTSDSNSLRAKWKLAAKLVGESWNKNKSFPETVEKFAKRNIREGNSITEEKLKNQVDKLISKNESSSLPVIPTSERLQRILEQQKALRSKAIVSSFPEQTNDDKRPTRSEKPKLKQLEQIKQPQTQKSFLSFELQESQISSHENLVKPLSLDSSVLPSSGKQESKGVSNFQSYVFKSALPSHVESIKRGDLKTASKKRRAYRDKKQKEELVDLDSEERSTIHRTSTGSTSSPSSRIKDKIFASSSLSTSFSGNDDQEAHSSTSATTDDVTALTFVRHSSGRLVYRDYSVDAKTEAIFNEFLQFDPNLEPKTTKRRKSFNKDEE